MKDKLQDYKIEETQSFTNMLDENDIVQALKKLATMRIEKVIQYLQGENLFALALDIKDKTELDNIKDEYEIVDDDKRIILRKKGSKSDDINLTEKINNDNLCNFSSKKEIDIESLKSNLTEYFSRKAHRVDKQEETNRDSITNATSSEGKRKEKAAELEGITLPTIDEEIKTFFEHEIVYSDQRPSSPIAASSIIENQKEKIEKKIEKSKKENNPKLENELNYYDELKSTLNDAHRYLEGRKPLDESTEPQKKKIKLTPPPTDKLHSRVGTSEEENKSKQEVNDRSVNKFV